MAEERVIVKGQLGVEREQPSVRTTDEGIDLHQRSVRFQERAIKTGQKLDRRTDLRRLQAQRKRDLARLERLQAHARIDVLLQNLFGCLGGDLLDLHADRKSTRLNSSHANIS